MPGLARVQPIGTREYECALSVAVGSIASDFQGTLELKDLHPPVSYRVTAGAMGAAGLVDGEGIILLEPRAGGTRLLFDADIRIRGRLASAGDGPLQTFARSLAQRTLEAIARGLESGTPGPAGQVETGTGFKANRASRAASPPSEVESSQPLPESTPKPPGKAGPLWARPAPAPASERSASPSGATAASDPSPRNRQSTPGPQGQPSQQSQQRNPRPEPTAPQPAGGEPSSKPRPAAASPAPASDPVPTRAQPSKAPAVTAQRKAARASTPQSAPISKPAPTAPAAETDPPATSGADPATPQTAVGADATDSTAPASSMPRPRISPPEGAAKLAARARSTLASWKQTILSPPLRPWLWALALAAYTVAVVLITRAASSP